MGAQVERISTREREAVVIDLRDSVLVSDPAGGVAIPPATPPGPYLRVGKPVFDTIVAGVLLLLVLPVLLTVAMVVRCSIGPGVLFRQRRVGRDGRTFTVYKFRTMLPDRRRSAEPYDGDDRRSTHKTTDDPRHTRVGRFLRRWSLDELPQLLNVLRGDMSLVGPRPELVDVVAEYEPWEHARHAVRPGLTGLWQIRARSKGPTHLFTHLDLEYVQAVSFANDLRILLATLPAALGAQKGW